MLDARISSNIQVQRLTLGRNIQLTSRAVTLAQMFKERQLTGFVMDSQAVGATQSRSGSDERDWFVSWVKRRHLIRWLLALALFLLFYRRLSIKSGFFLDFRQENSETHKEKIKFRDNFASIDEDQVVWSEAPGQLVNLVVKLFTQNHFPVVSCETLILLIVIIIHCICITT